MTTESKREIQFARRVALMGLVLFLICSHLVPNREVGSEFFLLMILTLYGEYRSIKLPGFGILNPGECFYLLSCCLHGPMYGALLASCAGLSGDYFKKKRSAVILFNVGWSLTTFSVAGMAFHLFSLPGAVVSYLLVASLLQARGEMHFSKLSFVRTSRSQVKELILLAPWTALLCYLGLILFGLDPRALVLLVAPIELLVAFVKTRELSAELRSTLRELELTQAELVATGRQAALGVMAAGIAHEINNPLAAAVTNIHILKTITSNKAAKGSLDLLEQSVDRCQNIVARMLKYSRSSEGSGVACELEEILTDALLFCGREFGTGHVQVRSQLAGLPKVKAEPTELVQIFSNLLSNAHDAGASLVKIKTRIHDSQLKLEFIDNGPGVPDELKERIFDPFFTTKAVGSGTGLGLSIAQGLAKGLGGQLHLTKSDTAGSTFELTLLLWV